MGFELMARTSTLGGGPLGVRNLPSGMGYTTGKYYGPSLIGGSFGTTVTISKDIDYWVPFLCRKTTTFDRIAIRNTSAVTEPFRLAIYVDDGGGHPGARVVDSGEITTSGAAADNAAAILAALTGGVLYWLAVNNNSATSSIAFEGFSSTGLNAWQNVADFAVGVTNANAAAGIAVRGTRSYAAFPATAAAITDLWSVAPYIRLRVA